jgi:hypothetical protein
MSKMFAGIAILVFSSFLAAQGIQVTSSDITDYRSSKSYSGKLEVRLIISGDLKNCRGLRKANLTKAVDDSGKDLLITKKDESQHHSMYDFNKLYGEQLETRIELKSPARKSKIIQEISGTLEVHYPDAKSKQIVKGFMKQTGKPLNIPALKKSKGQLSVLNKTQFEALKKQQEEAEASKKQNLGDVMMTALSSLFSGFFSMEENDLLISVSDPTNQIVDVEFQNAAGEPIETLSRSVQGDNIIYSFDTPPPDDAQLVVYTATTASIKKVPFSVKNVTLP